MKIKIKINNKIILIKNKNALKRKMKRINLTIKIIVI